jgi:fructose-specific phosphotransferase system IIA component
VQLYPRIESLVRTQLRALLRASAGRPLRIMIPMVASVDEVRWVRRIVTEEQGRLAQGTGPRPPGISLGAMIEVPAAVLALPGLCRELDFFSIGSNDLLHYFTATDRMQRLPTALCQPTAPAFLRLLKKIVDETRARGKWVGLCGEMGGQPHYLPLLVGLGLDEISMAASSILPVKEQLPQVSAVDCRQLLSQALTCATADEVETLLTQSSARESVPLVEAELLLMDSDAATKAEAIKELCDALYVTGRTDTPRKIEEAVWQREAAYSTGFGHGFAIPHCKTNAVRANSLGVLKSRCPLPWAAADDQPVQTVFLLAIREADQATEHMKILAHLARRLMHDDFRDRVEREQDAAALLVFLAAQLEIDKAQDRADTAPAQ